MTRYDVLIVDDEQDFRDIMVKKLGKRELSCDSAPDGATALEMIKVSSPIPVSDAPRGFYRLRVSVRP